MKKMLITPSFVTAVRCEKEYKSSHGSVKVTETEAERIALSEISEVGGETVFSAEGHSLRMKLTELDCGIKAELFGEEGYAYEFRIPATEDEAIFGGGEQYRKLNLRGEKVVNFVSEHIKASTIIEKALWPKTLYREKDHGEIGTYSPMPVFVTSEKRLIKFDTASDGYSEFGDSEYLFRFDSCPESLTLLSADSFEALSCELQKLVPNRQYLPDWCHDGMILGVQGGTETILEKAFAMLDEGVKVSAVWSQDWSGENRTIMGKQVWWNWEVDDKLYPDLEGAIKKLNERGVKFLGYINPYLVKGSELYNYCKKQGYLITHTDGTVYHIKSTTFDAGMLDLTNPAAVRYTKDILIKRNMLDLGMSGWMADFGEYLPADCVLHDGDPKKLHNLWPVMWAKLNREAIEEYGSDDVFFFTRSGYTGIQTYAPIMWNGDQHTDTTHDYGMPSVMPASFSLGFSGVSLVHCDIGGFFSFMKLKRNDELFIRWMEMSTFSPLMRSHESIRPWANSQFDAEGVLPYTARLTRLHAAIKPYVQDCVKKAQSGIPVIRPDFWAANDYSAHRNEYTYMFGDDVFVAPIIIMGARLRTVNLPEGDWIHLWSGKKYPGGKRYLIKAPLGECPVFYRADSKYSELFRLAAAE